MSMHCQHEHDQPSIAAPAPQAVQHEFVGLYQDSGTYYFFREGHWHLCPSQDPYTLAKILAAKQAGSVFTISNSTPMLQLDPIDMQHVISDSQLTTPYMESPYDSSHNQYFTPSIGYQVIDHLVLH
jgi:hypothetical protein